MKTKLVYVLTCDPECTYIEQALISIWSARHHNPNAYIVLLVDDITNTLLKEGRGKLLEYISEKIVIDLPAGMFMRERSRWIKTSVRNLISGDFLFIDIDTIITSSLDIIDSNTAEVAAVLDYHMNVENYPSFLKDLLKKRLDKIGVDINKVSCYFSSGVMYVKDCATSRCLYEKWHNAWFKGLSNGFIGDQPYLLKADMDMEGVISTLDWKWNCIMYTYPKNEFQAYILHFSAFENMSFLFDNNCLSVIRQQGIDNFKNMILVPQKTYIAHLESHLISSYRNIYEALQFINNYCPNSLNSYLIKFTSKDLVSRLIKKGNYNMAVLYICIKSILNNIHSTLIKIYKKCIK